LAQLTGGDHLVAVGQPDIENACVYRVTQVRDLDVGRQVLQGTVVSVDAGGGTVTLAPISGASSIVLSLGKTSSVRGLTGEVLSLAALPQSAGVTVTGTFNTRTSTFLGVRSIQETRLAIPLDVTVSRPTVQPSAIESLVVQTAPNATISVVTSFPGAPSTTTKASVDVGGVESVTVPVPLDAYASDSQTATASVQATVGSLTRSVDVTFRVTVPRLALYLSSNRIHTGESQRVTTVSHPGRHVRITVVFPNRATLGETRKQTSTVW